MCLNPKPIKMKNGEYLPVPCGKCVECIKDKQNEVGILCYRTAELYGSMEFVTLTYSNDSIPMYFRFYDEDRGDILPDIETQRLTEGIEKQAREYYFNQSQDCLHTMTYTIGEDEDAFTVEIAPSLSRYDVRMWIKRARMQYKRKYGEDLPDFKYCVIGEYGPRTGRPHYHMAVFGLSRLQVDFMVDDWKKTKGFAFVEDVQRFTGKSGHDGWEAAARYIGKYMSKGKFEDEKVKNEMVEKPRRINSTGFGYKDDIDELRNYYLCFDLVGEYDPNDRRSIYKIPKKKREQLFKEIIKRRKYKVNGKDYKLPRSLKRRLFYRKYKETQLDGTVKVVERASEIQKMVSKFIQDNLFKDFNEQLAALRVSYNDQVPYQVMCNLTHDIFHSNEDRASLIEKAAIRQYQKSIF